MLSSCSSKDPGAYDDFALCISDYGAKMYGTEWCSHCNAQKDMFGNSFRNVNFIDCDQNKDACLRAGIQAYPTWIIAGEMYEGTQSMESLAELTDCEL
ncbi:hypothetical protein H6503_06885 [Candidatus Woesearchaeota archaeon]|nr:hypothetical protein [Candidatus Woesearchaeota archaeon]